MIEPTDSSSSVYALAQRVGGFHHLCFKGDDLETALGNLKDHGLSVLTLLNPGEASRNEKIAFVFAGQGEHIALIDTEKANRTDPKINYDVWEQ